jgi:LacI family transcriptional regulator
MIFSPRIDDAEGDGDGYGQDHDLPAVRIGRAGTGTNALAVDGDDEQGAFAAVSHLATLGHKRIGMVANANLSYTVSVTRVQGYRQALQAHGIPFDERLLTVGQFTRQSGQDSMARLLDIDEPPSAVFISSDRMALGAMRAARDRGLRIPEDIAIVGYDDLFVAEHTNPPLTTVRAPIDAISQCATNMLIEAIRGGKRIGSRQIILPTELIVRQSCGAKAATSYA